MNEWRRREDYLKGRGAKPPPPPVLDPPEMARRIVDLYLGNLRVLQGLSVEYQFELICFWQPLPYIDKPLTAYERSASSEISAARVRLIRLTYDRIATQPVPKFFHDLRSTFASQPEPRYLDSCHLAPQGNEEVAQAMLPLVRAALQRRPAPPPK